MNRDEYVEALKHKLDEWNEQISKIESQMNSASEDAKSRYQEQLTEMRNHALAAEENFQALVKGQSEEWDKQRETFEKAWSDIAAGFGRAWSRFH